MVAGSGGLKSTGDKKLDRIAREEEAELMEKVASEPLPKSLEGFKKHRLYCLDQHLHKFQGVYPKKVVGMFKGLPVYLRANIQRLETASSWKRQGRVVDEGEKAFKVVSRKAAKGKTKDEEQEQDGEGMDLFGLWQV